VGVREAPLTLSPSRDQLIKDEPGTLVWREMGPDGIPRVVKLYRRRGLLSLVRCRLTRFRVEREYRRLRRLARWGVPCTEPLGWATGRTRGHGSWEALVMREVPGAIQLRDHLDRTDGIEGLADLFRIVRRMHQAGLCHQALYARNVLVRPGAPPPERYYISDLPRSWTFPQGLAGTGVARHDLLDLTWSIREQGVPAEAIPVEAYALDESERLWRRQGGVSGLREAPDARSKLSRLRRDLSVRVRWALSWAIAWSIGRATRASPPEAPGGRRSHRSGGGPAT
jgi:hypothetical protein